VNAGVTAADGRRFAVDHASIQSCIRIGRSRMLPVLVYDFVMPIAQIQDRVEYLWMPAWSQENLNTLIKASGGKIDSFFPALFAKMCQGTASRGTSRVLKRGSQCTAAEERRESLRVSEMPPQGSGRLGKRR